MASLLGNAVLGNLNLNAVPQGEQLYTLTNMRPDGRNHIHSVMYSAPPQGALLPICTPVQLEEVTDRVITFRDLNSHRRYRYIIHRSARSGVQSHVQRYFGTGCPAQGSSGAAGPGSGSGKASPPAGSAPGGSPPGRRT